MYPAIDFTAAIDEGWLMAAWLIEALWPVLLVFVYLTVGVFIVRAVARALRRVAGLEPRGRMDYSDDGREFYEAQQEQARIDAIRRRSVSDDDL